MNKEELNVLIQKLIEKHAAKFVATGYEYIGYHPYTDEQANLLYIRIRLKHQNGKKWIRPFHFNLAEKEWVMAEPEFLSEKPLYRLAEIKNNCETVVWLHEGETCVEAMEKYGFVSTTSGSFTSVSNTDFSPLSNRVVNIWPDNNSAGFNFAADVTKKLLNIGCSVKWVDIIKLNLPEGGDIVDWLREKPALTDEDIKNIKEDIFSLPLIEPPLYEQNKIENKNNSNAYINYRNASEIKIKAYQWLWPDRFARGKVSMISGNPGLGKSQISASMAATITLGITWPDGIKCEPGRVVILSAEDDAADTIVPRLKAANADLTRVDIIDSVIETDPNGNKLEGQFNLATDIEALEKLLIELKDVAAIFIDPITAYLGNTDDHKNSRVRSVLSPLARLAEKYGVAIICVSHHNKGGSQEALLRVIGSIGFVAASRAAFAVIKDKDDESKRLFLPLKNNIGNDKIGLAFKIESHELEDNIMTSRIVWLDEKVTITADEAMSPSSDDEKSTLDEAVEFLSDLLKDGLQFVKDIFKCAEENCISEKTLRKAKNILGIKIGRQGFGKGSKSYWYL